MIIVLGTILILLGWEIYNLNAKRVALRRNLEEIGGDVGALEAESQKLRADLEYFADPENLIKELKSKFNYKKPGEKLIIVVPGNNNQ